MLGVLLCAALVVTLPSTSVLAGLGVLALGVGHRLLVVRRPAARAL